MAGMLENGEKGGGGDSRETTYVVCLCCHLEAVGGTDFFPIMLEKLRKILSVSI